MKVFNRIQKTAQLLLLYLSMLSIRSKKIYVFGAWQGKKFADNSKYLFLQAIQDKSIKAFWITKRRDIFEAMRKKGYPVYMHNSLKGIYYQLRAGYYFTSERKNDVSAVLVGNATRINLWHGVGLKKILYDVKSKKSLKPKSKRRRFWSKVNHYPYRKEFVLSTSDTMTRIFASAFNKPVEKIWQLGQPRNDVFFKSELEVEKLPFLNGNQRMILYMPTHRLAGKTAFRLSEIMDLAELNQFCAKHNLLFVIKKHFYHREEKENLEAYKHLLDISSTEYDTQLLLKHASVLISDYSSCYVDYLLLDKPVIFYNFDYQNYVLNDRDLYFDYTDTTPGPKVTDFSGLLNCLENSVSGQDKDYGCDRERVKYIFYSKENQKAVGEKILARVKEIA